MEITRPYIPRHHHIKTPSFVTIPVIFAQPPILQIFQRRILSSITYHLHLCHHSFIHFFHLLLSLSIRTLISLLSRPLRFELVSPNYGVYQINLKAYPKVKYRLGRTGRTEDFRKPRTDVE